MHEVDLRYLCTAHQVHERGLRLFLNAVLELGDSPCSLEAIAERIAYSREQAHRFQRALSWHDKHNPPVISKDESRERGGRGIKGRRLVNQVRAARLGLIDYAA